MRPAAKVSIAVAVILSTAFVYATALAIATASSRAEERPGLLYFTHSAGYRHDVIPVSQGILKEIGATAPGFEVTASEDVSIFTAENLSLTLAKI
jgi:hypothetical protein